MSDNPFDEPAQALFNRDAIHIEGTFDGFPVTYVTLIEPENLSVGLAVVTANLREMGVEPRTTPAAVAAPVAQQARGGGGNGGGNWPQRQAPAQPQAFYGGEAPPWMTCGHDVSNIKTNKNYGFLECGFSSQHEFADAKPFQRRDGTWVYYCKSREPKRG